VVLDSGGRATVYVSTSAYKFVLKTSADVTIWTQDNVQVFNPNVTATLGGAGINTSASSGVPSINSGTWSVNAITPNGVLCGGASNALSFTAAPSANTILTVSGGVPTWSAAPTIGTSLTSPIHYGGTGASSTLTLAGTSNGSPSSAYVLLNPSGQGNVGIGTTTPTYFLDAATSNSGASPN
jgi:hypothetical protein